MTFILLAVGVGFALAFVLGGRPRMLAGRTLRLWFLLPVGLAINIAAAEQHGHTWPFVLVLLSAAFLFLFAVVNLPVTGMWMVTLGLVLNALVVGVNHGMPVGKKAIRSIGHQPAVYAVEHHVQRHSDKLTFLGDIVPVRPIGEVVSFGDLILAVGLVDVLVRVTRPVRKRREDETPADETLELAASPR